MNQFYAPRHTRGTRQTTVASHDHGVQYFRERQVDGIVGAQVVSKLPYAIEKRLVGMALQVQSAKVFQGPRSARLCGIAEAFAKTGEIMPLVRVVGHRRADGDAFDDQGRLARTAALLRGTAWLVPRGVYLFSSFDEAEAWMTETILRTRERLSQRTSSGSAGR